MLILKADRVRFCQATRWVAGEMTLLEALEYRGRLFAGGELFERAQKKEALQRMRDVLDAPQDIMAVMVDDARGYTLWYEDGEIVEMTAAARAASENGELQLALNVGDSQKAESTISQLFPTFHRIAERLRPGQQVSKAILVGQGQN